MQLQLFDQEFADSFDFDILDPTKIIPEEILPPIPVGRLVLDRMPDNFFAETEQVAFMTQNVPPGIDFSNDPLLQGRNFSYLDTQIKRLGGPNFTHLPINAPKCPFHNFQQDGHMAMRNPVGRANYQPNSWDEGPRESPARLPSLPAEEQGPKVRLRPETFADHYSQARQFYISQTPPEQRHIAAALTFELSKVETPVIRERIVSHLLNIDETLANKVGRRARPASRCRSPPMPPCRRGRISSRRRRSASSSDGPKRFEGRKLGILVTDGTDAAILKALHGRDRRRKAQRSKSSRRRSAAPTPATAAGSRRSR